MPTLRSNSQGSAGPLPTAIARAAIAVCRDALHWRDDLRAIFLAAGVQRSHYDRYDLPELSKAKIARAILDDLGTLGSTGHSAQRKVVEELCQMNRPHADAPDQRAGTEALAELKREATAARMLVNPEHAATDARKAAEKRRVQAIAERRLILGELHTEFIALVHQANGQSVQGRGYDFEKILARLFKAHDLDYRPSYRTDREQIDGSFHFRGFTYLVEARWRAAQPDLGDLLDFKGKVDAKLDSTRGVFISMAGFDPDVLDYFVRNSRGSRNNIIMFTGQDISQLFEGNVGLVDALTKKVDAAEQEGVALCEL
ncbi:restriction endonuclease [Kitasatospora purpeofusca]|uniref:restriction endonuclease n=1 Tax=Kitasatospora purpeofusca TaxID=67352 RepID=UPI00365E307C